MKYKTVSIKEVMNHPNMSLSPKDYIKTFPGWKRWMNKKCGYREDWEGMTIWKFIKRFTRYYFVEWNHYHNNHSRSEFRKIKMPNARGTYGRGSWTEHGWVTIPAPGKKSYETFSLTFFWFTPFAFKFQFHWSRSVFFSCEFSFSLLKPNIQFILGFKRNTA